MDELILSRDSPELSDNELAAARQICDEAMQSVLGREDFMRRNAVDEKFALPDANWSLESANEFVLVFKRIAAGAAADLNLLRRFTQVFTGFNIYEALPGNVSAVTSHDLTTEGDSTPAWPSGFASATASTCSSTELSSLACPRRACCDRPLGSAKWGTG